MEVFLQLLSNIMVESPLTMKNGAMQVRLSGSQVNIPPLDPSTGCTFIVKFFRMGVNGDFYLSEAPTGRG